MALSLGLVISSTFLSPLTTPAALKLLASGSGGLVSRELGVLAGPDGRPFSVSGFSAPSAVGVLFRYLVGQRCISRIEKGLGLLSSLVLLVLCYSSAAQCLPLAARSPDWDFLGLTFFVVLGLCLVGFIAGRSIGKLMRLDPSRSASMTFGLGMNNNGTGLVLASAAFASRPAALLPIVLYNLTQHVVAGLVHRAMQRSVGADESGLETSQAEEAGIR